MSDNANEKKNLLTSVSGELQGEKVKAVRGKLKEVLKDREKAVEAVKAIDSKIKDILLEAGESEKDVETALKSL